MDGAGRTREYSNCGGTTRCCICSKLYHDELKANSSVNPPLEAQHSIIYVWKGSRHNEGQPQEGHRQLTPRTLPQSRPVPNGAVLWRWELVPQTDPIHLLQGKGVSSALRMSRKVKMFELVPTSKWLFRLDCIVENEGSTGLHCHPGSGIRCMLNGQLRVRSDKGESSDNTQTGRLLVRRRRLPAGIHHRPGQQGHLSERDGAAARI